MSSPGHSARLGVKQGTPTRKNVAPAGATGQQSPSLTLAGTKTDSQEFADRVSAFDSRNAVQSQQAPLASVFEPPHEKDQQPDEEDAKQSNGSADKAAKPDEDTVASLPNVPRSSPLKSEQKLAQLADQKFAAGITRNDTLQMMKKQRGSVKSVVFHGPATVVEDKEEQDDDSGSSSDDAGDDEFESVEVVDDDDNEKDTDQSATQNTPERGSLISSSSSAFSKPKRHGDTPPAEPPASDAVDLEEELQEEDELDQYFANALDEELSRLEELERNTGDADRVRYVQRMLEVEANRQLRRRQRESKRAVAALEKRKGGAVSVISVDIPSLELRSLLAALFELTRRLHRAGLLDATQRGFLKDMVVRHDPGVLAAAKRYASNGNAAQFQRGVVDLVSQPGSGRSATDDADTAAYLRNAKLLFDVIDRDGRQAVTLKQVLDVLEDSPAVSEAQLAALAVRAGADPEALLVFPEFARMCVDIGLNLLDRRGGDSTSQ